MKGLAYIVGIAIVIVSSVVGIQFIVDIQNHRHLDYFHNGTLFQALSAIVLGLIFIVLAEILDAIRAKSEQADDGVE